jgi:hypothetical protein
MKMKPKHFKEFSVIVLAALKRLGGDRLLNEMEYGLLPYSPNVKDLQEFFCWYVLNGDEEALGYYTRNLANYLLLDSYIYTALKKILPTVTRRY